jgi:hypothetical protein
MYNEDLHDLHPSLNIIRSAKSRWVRWAGPVAPMGAKRNIYNFLTGIHEEMGLLGRSWLSWEDNIKMEHICEKMKYLKVFHGKAKKKKKERPLERPRRR